MNRGITLIELLMGIALVAILGVTASLSLPTLQIRDALRNETLRLASNIHLLVAISRFREINFELNLQSNHYATQPTDILSHQLANGVQILSPHRSLRFYANGTVSPTSIVLSKDEARCSVVVSLRARVRTVC